MAEPNNGLPEGTDTILEAGGTGASNATGGRSMTASDRGTDSLITDGTNENSGGIRGMISTAGTKARDEAATRARGLVSQGLTSGSAALGNVASIIGDTVEQIGERLGPQYADYARSASETVNRYATTLQSKDPDELVDDARELVRKSPGLALAGAAIVGFGLVRLLKAGIDAGDTSGGRARNNRHTD
ncbi:MULTISPECIES: hypothetical protein [Sphingomonas]|uniref:hypothetical protein n=1 Tax=Sphingomonas TaxID=13687 RepID=UPI0013B42D3D|nr:MULTISPECIES: hypothetical protein [Sphingomonas]